MDKGKLTTNGNSSTSTSIVLNEGYKYTNKKTKKITSPCEDLSTNQLAQINIMNNTLVQLNFTNFDGVSEKLKLLNHSYGVVTSSTEIDNAYKVKFFGQQSAMSSSYVCKVEDLVIPQKVPIKLHLSPQQFLEKMCIFDSLSAYQKALTEFSGGVGRSRSSKDSAE